MKRYNIVTKKTYTNKGAEKTSWPIVGTLVKFDATEERPEDSFIIELNMFPETKFSVFEQKPKEDKPTVKNESVIGTDGEEIPF